MYTDVHSVLTVALALMRRPPTKNDLLLSAEGKLRGIS